MTAAGLSWLNHLSNACYWERMFLVLHRAPKQSKRNLARQFPSVKNGAPQPKMCWQAAGMAMAAFIFYL